MAGSIQKDTKTGKYFFVVDVGPKGGPRVQKRKRGFKTKKEAQKALNELLNSVYNGEYVEPSKMTFKNFLEEWLKTRKHSVGEQTFNSDRTTVKNRLIPELGNTKLANINKMQLQSFINMLHEEKQLAPATVKRVH